MAYINTPGATDASHVSDRFDPIGNISPEKSFLVPNENRDLLSQMKNIKNQSASLKTPRPDLRDPLRLLPNGNRPRAEFTPLMHSATKKNMARRLSARKFSVTPSYLRESRTPGPRLSDISHLGTEHTSSSAGAIDNTPMPQQISSSAQSTPLAQLPGRDAAGLVNDGNMMTLREQESIIDKIEKENFGLKMKIHFLEEALSKRGGDFNHAALKENTDLKVNKITMQRELHKFKKHIAQAEKDAEVYRLQLEEFKERIRRKQVDESIRIELESLRSEVKTKEKQISQFESDKGRAEDQEKSTLKKLREDIEDLQADLREKDRAIDERDDQIDALKVKASKESNDAAEIEDELDSARQEIEDLKQSLERAKDDAKEAKEAQEEALDDKRRAEEDLDELRDEMANKSFTTKGLSRQLEDKTNKLEDELQDLQEQHDLLKAELAQKSDSERQLRDRVRDLEREGASDHRKLQQDLELSQQQRDTFERKLINMTKQLETVERELLIKTEEKDLLQTRHDALTKESADLQKDLAKTRKAVEDLENALDDERQRAAQNDNVLRSQHKQEIDLVNEQVDQLHREVNSKERDHAADLEEWEAQKRTLEASSQRAEEKAVGLQRTVDRLQESQGTVNGRELKLQAALESEKQRHQQEEKVLSKQIEELQQDLANKRTASDGSRLELNNAKEELRISIRDQAALKEKVAELEEEIEVLQADIEQEHEFAEKQQQKYSSSADAQVQKMRQEKQSLQEEVSKVRSELQNANMALEMSEKERDEMEAKLQNAQHKSNDDTFNVDQEKRELRRLKVKLEQDVARLTSERDNLQDANQSLEDEINAGLERASNEENRLNAEIDSMRNLKMANSDNRDRELTSAKNKVARLETRIKELEDMLDNQSRVIGSPAADISGLRHDLSEARKNETAATKRETDLKTANRDLKMKLNDLERDLHEARLAQYKASSPSASPPPSHSKELAKLRQDLVDAQAEVKVLGTENRDLKRAARRFSTDEELATLQAQLKSRAVEIDSLNDKIVEQNDVVDALREQLNRPREDKSTTERSSSELRKRDRHINDLKAQIKQLEEEQFELNDVSMRLSTRDSEAREMKRHLRRLREERSDANKKAEAVENELEVLQSKYEDMLERLTSGKSSKDEIRAKEMKGLIKEIMWLKAKCRREERLRKDLAWSKALLEQNEAMRAECNQVDLRILGEMGVSLDKRKYEVKLKPVQKFRAGVFAVIAAIRMSNMEEQWRDAKLLGEELKLIKTRQAKPRSRIRVLEV